MGFLSSAFKSVKSGFKTASKFVKKSPLGAVAKVGKSVVSAVVPGAGMVFSAVDVASSAIDGIGASAKKVNASPKTVAQRIDAITSKPRTYNEVTKKIRK